MCWIELFMPMRGTHLCEELAAHRAAAEAFSDISYRNMNMGQHYDIMLLHIYF
jgi:hypothetical protein